MKNKLQFPTQTKWMDIQNKVYQEKTSFKKDKKLQAISFENDFYKFSNNQI